MAATKDHASVSPAVHFTMEVLQVHHMLASFTHNQTVKEMDMPLNIWLDFHLEHFRSAVLIYVSDFNLNLVNI